MKQFLKLLPADASERDKLKRHRNYLRRKTHRVSIAFRVAKRRADTAPERDVFLDAKVKRLTINCEVIEAELRDALALLDEIEAGWRDDWAMKG